VSARAFACWLLQRLPLDPPLDRRDGADRNEDDACDGAHEAAPGGDSGPVEQEGDVGVRKIARAVSTPEAGPSYRVAVSGFSQLRPGNFAKSPSVEQSVRPASIASAAR